MEVQARPGSMLLLSQLVTNDTIQACVRKAAEDLLSITRGAWLRSVGRATTLVEATQLSGAQLAQLLGLSAPSYERRRSTDNFSTTQRNKLSRIANVVERAHRVLGGGVRAQQWLTHPNRALRFSTPLALLTTREGMQRVDGILMRMEAGAFA